MRQNQTSTTAIGIAMMRAVESERPEDERIICDRYARLFVPGWLYWTGKFFIAIGYAEWRGPGVLGFLVARERYIDERLAAAISGGVRQVVILGAGYDARAYRFQDLLRGVQVFEVDHPATLARKVARLKAILGQLPAGVQYVSVEFNSQSLEERLPACGYDPSAKTLFIWQGVTYYLTEAAIDSTLAFVRHHSGSGSSIVFDYIDRSILERTGRHGEVANLRRYRGLTGEGMSFGIPDGTIGTFLSQRGLVRVELVGSEDLRRLYFTGQRQPRTVASGYAIASASVP